MLGKFLRFFRDDDRPLRTGRPLSGGEPAKLGLTLSSGGAPGIAHVGALWAAGSSGKELGNLAEEMPDRRFLVISVKPLIDASTP